MELVYASGNPWIVDDRVAPDKPLDSAVLTRLKKFSAMHKLKKMALRVSFIHICYYYFLQLWMFLTEIWQSTYWPCAQDCWVIIASSYSCMRIYDVELISWTLEMNNIGFLNESYWETVKIKGDSKDKFWSIMFLFWF